MVSLVNVFCVCGLLLVCGANVDQITAASPTLDRLQVLSILVGTFSNEDEVKDEKDHYGTEFVEFIPLKYQPIDIPVLNQYTPLLLEEKKDGVLYRLCIVLIVPGGDGEYLSTYYNITDVAGYRSGSLNLAELTRDDLAEQPLCKGVITRTKDIVVHEVECGTDNKEGSAFYVHSHQCKTCVVVLGSGSHEKHLNSTPYAFNKVVQYSLPPSWLEGVDDYVNPCDV